MADQEFSAAPPPLPDQPVAPQGEGARSHAQLHQTESTRTYPCGTCGGELVFHIGAQQLKCPNCGNVQALAEARGAVVERDLRAAMTEMKGRGTEVQGLVSGEKEIVCQNCGGHTTFTGTWTAQRCPYCATPIQRDDVHDAPQRLAVDGIMPFLVDDKAASTQLKEWVGSRWFAPNEFKDYSRAGSFSSIYTAYFTYDAQTRTTYRGERGDHYTVTVGSGEDQRTETRTRWSHRSGVVDNAFDDVTILANEGLNRGHTDALQPWPMEQVKPFSPEFIAGHLSRTYDHDVEACFTDAQQVMEGVIDGTVRRDIGGDEQRVHDTSISWGTMTFKHVLLPIWLLAVVYNNQTYQVMINGATGKVEGERPYSKIKIAAAVVAALIIIAIVVILFAGGG